MLVLLLDVLFFFFCFVLFCFYLPKARTNYGKYNIRSLGIKIWNEIDVFLSL